MNMSKWHNGVWILLRKKFQGMKFCDFYELAAKVSEYEKLLREENQRKKASMGTYFQEVFNTEVATSELTNNGFYICPLLEKKTSEA